MNKVLAIAPYSYLPYFSGGQKFIARFLDWLGKEVDLTVISVEGNDFSMATTYKGLPWLKKSRSRYFDRSLISRISELIKEQGLDTLILEHPYYAWLAFAVRKKTGINVIIHTHNIEYQRFRSTGKWWWPLLKNYEKNAFSKADGLVFITSRDLDFAVQTWSIKKQKCYELPYGIDATGYPADRALARKEVALRHNITPEENILLFAGLLNYKPNADAVKIITDQIEPILSEDVDYSYKILICGKGRLEELRSSSPKIIFTGFVEDIDQYYKAADILLNPVLSGGGVKTKLIEAVAAGATVVSTETGAIGINDQVFGSKLILVPDNDWSAFGEKIKMESKNNIPTPPHFYKTYYWSQIIKGFSKWLSNEFARQ